MTREYSVQTCSAWDENLVCRNGVSWIDISNNKGYCESHASNAPLLVQTNLRHVYYGEPYLDGEGGDPVEWGQGDDDEWSEPLNDCDVPDNMFPE